MRGYIGVTVGWPMVFLQIMLQVCWPYYNHLCFAIETKPVDSLTHAKSSYELISELCVLELCVRVVAGMWSPTFWGCDHSHSVDVITHILWMWSPTFWGCDHSHSVDVITHILWMWSLTFCDKVLASNVWVFVRNCLNTNVVVTMADNPSSTHIAASSGHNSLYWLPNFHTHCGKLRYDTIPWIDYPSSTHIAASSGHNSMYWLPNFHTHCGELRYDTIPCIDNPSSTHIAGSLDTTQFPALITHFPHT